MLELKKQFIKNVFVFLSFLCVLLSVPVTFAVPPLLYEVVIADVTDRSFSLVWTSDQPGQPTVEVYSDALGVQPVLSGISLTPYDLLTGNPALDALQRQSSKDSIIQSAKSFGIVKITVSGLVSGTDYFIKFGLQADATLETTLCPDDGVIFCSESSLMPVKTQRQPVRTTSTSELFLNDNLLVLDVAAQIGELVIVGVETSDYPVSAFIGDGVPAPYTIVDVNNLYSTSSNQSLALNGSVIKTFGDVGEGLVIRHYKGASGSVTGMQVSGISQGAGLLMTPIDRDYGDCNSDGRINGYDDQLLASAVAGTLTPADYESVAFHPVLCNLYKENGLDSVTTTNIVLDGQDGARLKALLIGKISLDSMPEAP